MKKSIPSRILILTFVYCMVFCLLVIMQFSQKGNFSISIESMVIRGRYNTHIDETEQSANDQITAKPLNGGIKIFFGGLEISLIEDNEKGMIITGINGVSYSVNPEVMLLEDNKAHFRLPGGTTLVFSSFTTSRGPELQIDAELEDDIAEITIPIESRKSSLVYDNGQPGILYNGDKYFFGKSNKELENAKLFLSKNNANISYGSRGKQTVFDPVNYVTNNSKNYKNVLSDWQDKSYVYWRQNASSLQNENDVISYLGESLRRGNYSEAAGSISRTFINSPQYSYRTAVFTGSISPARRLFIEEELNKNNRIIRLNTEKSPDILLEDHLFDFLFTRSSIPLVNEILNFLHSTDLEKITLSHCPGILEAFSDLKQWRPEESKIIELFIDRVLALISENIIYDHEKDIVIVLNNEQFDSAENLLFNMKLGKALLYWAETTDNNEWAAVSHSIILSALTTGGVGAGNLYNVLKPLDYYPRAAWLMNNGLWAWTVSPSMKASYVGEDLNISVSFPQYLTHYIMIRGVRPFVKIQIHNMDFRTDSQFETYDSSGWIYYQQDQILILKLKHRLPVEDVRVFYRVEPPPVVREPVIIEVPPDNIQ